MSEQVPSWNRLSLMEQNNGERKPGIRYSEAFKMDRGQRVEKRLKSGRSVVRSQAHIAPE